MKTINRNSIELGDVYKWDHPDYVDAYIEYAEWDDGTPLTEEELDQANYTEHELINEIVNERAWGG